MLNEARLLGRVGNDPELRVTQTNKKVVQLNVATWKSYLDKNKPNEQTGNPGAWQTVTEWHRVVCWEKSAEVAEKFSKGDLILVSGEITTREWDDKDGNKHYMTEIVGHARLVKKGGNTPTGGTQSQTTYTPPDVSMPETGSDPGEEDDLPF